MKLLIVDDELFIRQSMQGFFNQPGFPFGQITSAEDGEKGLILALEQKPDIIISDVVMPGMNGLEFVQKAKEANPGCEALMISGHEESAYIRQAMKFDAVDYLLKPIDIDELERVVRKIIDRVRAKHTEKQVLEEMARRVRDSRELWAGKLFEVLSAHSFLSEDEVRQQLGLIGSALDPDSTVAAAYLGVDESLEDMDFKDRQMVRMLLLSAAEREIATRSAGALAALHGTDLLGILMNVEERDGGERISELAKAIQQEVNDKLQKTVAIGVGGSVPDVFHAHESCRNARAALIEASLAGKNRIAAAREPRADGQMFSPVSDALQWMKGLYENANVSLLRNLLSENYADWLKGKAEGLQKELNDQKADASGRIVDMALGIINRRFREPINLQTAADEIGITPNYLSALFKDATGENFTVILTRKRLEMAEDLLTNSDEPIARIAEVTGFGDCNYFGKVFKKAYSVTPGAYRKQAQP